MLSIKNIFYKLVYGIRNLFKYFKLIWNDRDYDQVFLYKYLLFKINNMNKEMFKYIDAEKELFERQEQCKILLQRLIDDDYCSDEFKILNEKYHLEQYDITNLHKMNPEYTEKLIEIAKVADEMKHHDINKLFEIMSQDIEKWWV